jgi:peptide deformylase
MVDPTRLRLQLYPAEVLRVKARPVEPTDEVRAVCRRMVELMREEDGIGLAAPQVGVSWRIFVCDVPPNDDPDEDSTRSEGDTPPTASAGVQVWLNPRIVASDRLVVPYSEGCLSLPGITGDVHRPDLVTMEAVTPEGEVVRAEAGGLLGRCWQHEIDHLDGVLILDRMTQASRFKNRSKVRAMEKSAS